MKKVIAACVEQILEFDTESAYAKYIQDLEAKKQWFEIVYKEYNCEVIVVRIKKQYNRHIMLA